MTQGQDPASLPSAPRRQRKPLRKLRNAGGRWLGRHFGAAAIAQLARCCRKTELNGEIRQRAEAEHGGLILAFWHGRGVLASPFYRPGNTTALVSASKLMSDEFPVGNGFDEVHWIYEAVADWVSSTTIDTITPFLSGTDPWYTRVK